MVPCYATGCDTPVHEPSVWLLEENLYSAWILPITRVGLIRLLRPGCRQSVGGYGVIRRRKYVYLMENLEGQTPSCIADELRVGPPAALLACDATAPDTIWALGVDVYGVNTRPADHTRVVGPNYDSSISIEEPRTT